jgi:hypothetical protein
MKAFLIVRKSVPRQDAEVQAIPGMDRPALAPVGSDFFELFLEVALG